MVERVFLRIGSAATDEALEAELNKFLPPIILKLTSPAEAVRKKACLSICFKIIYTVYTFKIEKNKLDITCIILGNS